MKNNNENNIRFWALVHSDWVKLTIQTGRPLFHATYSKNDEGFSSSKTVWTREGNKVAMAWNDRARDCDGLIESGGKMVANIGELRAKVQDGGICSPLWKRVSYSQRDYQAESANYR